MAIPTFVAAGAAAAGTGAIGTGAAPDVPIPAGIQADDILLLFVATPNQSPASITAPEGWSQVADSPQGTGTAGTSTATAIAIFWKRTSGSEATPEAADVFDNWVAAMAAFRGCITTGDPWDVTAGSVETTSDTSGSIPGDTTTVDDCLIVLACSTTIGAAANQFSGWSNGDLANVAEIIDAVTALGNDSGFGVAIGEKASAGAYGDTSVTLATASAKGMISIALKPEPDGDETLFFTGSITPAGSLSKTVMKPYSGSITPASALLKTITKPFTASVTPAGSLFKTITKPFTGSISLSGSLTSLKLIVRSFTATITPTGAFTKISIKSFVGLITPVGSFTRAASFVRTHAATIAPAGALFKTIYKSFTALISPIGTFIGGLFGVADKVKVVVSDRLKTQAVVSDQVKTRAVVSD